MMFGRGSISFCDAILTASLRENCRMNRIIFGQSRAGTPSFWNALCAAETVAAAAMVHCFFFEIFSKQDALYVKFASPKPPKVKMLHPSAPKIMDVLVGHSKENENYDNSKSYCQQFVSLLLMVQKSDYSVEVGVLSHYGVSKASQVVGISLHHQRSFLGISWEITDHPCLTPKIPIQLQGRRKVFHCWQ